MFASDLDERKHRINMAISAARHTKILCLSDLSMDQFIINQHLPWLESLVRLDLSNNNIHSIPDLSRFTGLRELWINGNPINTLPNISELKRLEVLDISHSEIERMPTYISTLPHLHILDWQNTPLERWLLAQDVLVNDLQGLIHILSQEHLRSNLEEELRDIFENFYIRKGSSMSLERIHSEYNNLLQYLRQSIPKIDDLKLFVRRASTLLPDDIAGIREEFVSSSLNKLRNFQRDTLRQRLSADLQINLRNFYFDQIEKQDVEAILKAIYDHVLALEDIEFLIKYSSQILPPSYSDAKDGERIWNNLTNLQTDMTTKRQVRWLDICLPL